MKEILTLIGEPYRSKGWYWNGHSFVLGAANDEDARNTICVYVSCRTTVTDGVRKAFVDVSLECRAFLGYAVLERALQYQKAGREVQMEEDARRYGKTFEEVAEEKLDGIMGVRLRDVFREGKPDRMKDGAIRLAFTPSTDLPAAGQCYACVLPLSRLVFRVSHSDCFQNVDSAMECYRRWADYYETRYNRRMYDELRGEPRELMMWPGVMILGRSSIQFADGRLLTLECLKECDGEFLVSVNAVDYPLQGILGEEVGELLQKK